MRGATRRTQVATPGVPCLACSGQINMLDVTLEMSGDLDDPEYIKRAGREPVSGRPNVAALCAGVSASQLELFVSLLAHPAGRGAPGPITVCAWAAPPRADAGHVPDLLPGRGADRTRRRPDRPLSSDRALELAARGWTESSPPSSPRMSRPDHRAIAEPLTT